MARTRALQFWLRYSDKSQPADTWYCKCFSMEAARTIARALNLTLPRTGPFFYAITTQGGGADTDSKKQNVFEDDNKQCEPNSEECYRQYCQVYGE